MDQVIANASYSIDELKFFVELSFLWFPTIKHARRGVHSLNLKGLKQENAVGHVHCEL